MSVITPEAVKLELGEREGEGEEVLLGMDAEGREEGMGEGDLVVSPTVPVGEAVGQAEREGLGELDTVALEEGVKLLLRFPERVIEGLGVKVSELAPVLEGDTLGVTERDLMDEAVAELTPTVEVGVVEKVGWRVKVGVLALEVEGEMELTEVVVGLPLDTREGVGLEVGDRVGLPVAEGLSKLEGVEE